MNENLIVSLKDIVVEFDGQKVLDGLSLDIHDKEFVTFLGPSGCGKTTTLRVIAGFVTPKSGNVFFDGKDIANMPPYKRPVNTVFQKYALFPHLDVFENIRLRPAHRQSAGGGDTAACHRNAGGGQPEGL